MSSSIPQNANSTEKQPLLNSHTALRPEEAFCQPCSDFPEIPLQASPAVDQTGNSFPTADRWTWISFETEIVTEDT